MLRIFLSPSNQTRNIYNDGKSSECDVCYDIATRVYNLLKNNLYCKLGNKFDSLAERCVDSDNYNADYHVCIHTNAGGGHGCEVFVHPKNVADKYVNKVYNNISKLTPSEDRGIKQSTTLYEISRPKAKTIYIEIDFHDTNGNWIINNKDEIAKSIASSFVELKEDKIKTNETLYKVQVGAFKELSNAKTMLKILESKNITGYIVKGGE